MESQKIFIQSPVGDVGDTQAQGMFCRTLTIFGGSYNQFSAEDSDYDGEVRVDYQPGAPGSLFVSTEKARGQVEDRIECSKKIARFRGSAGPLGMVARYQ